MCRGREHNLFPIEFTIYAVYGLGFAVCAWLASAVAARWFARAPATG